MSIPCAVSVLDFTVSSYCLFLLLFGLRRVGKHDADLRLVPCRGEPKFQDMAKELEVKLVTGELEDPHTKLENRYRLIELESGESRHQHQVKKIELEIGNLCFFMVRGRNRIVLGSYVQVPCQALEQLMASCRFNLTRRASL